MPTKQFCPLITQACLLALVVSSTAQAENPSDIQIKDFSHETPAEKAERMAWFNEARFGMFIHWGLYAQPAGVWKGKEVGGIGEWIQNGAQIPVSEYSELQKTFNPIKYNAEEWVKIAKQAGMKYIVITSKHHDGFCLFESEHSDWDMGGTPYKKDLLKPLAEACRKHGLKICFYHSIMDWHHPHYGNKATWRGNHATTEPDMNVYRTYMKNQLHELLTEYGDVGIVWFDGEWESSWTHEMGVDLYNYCRTLQPNTIVNNRVDKGRAGMAGMTKEGEFRGDYGTPEQEIPHTGFGEGVYWESCMTMNNTWGFKKNDHNWKSNKTLIRNLIDIASKGGNFLLNVGPTAEGQIPVASVERLQAIGEWMEINGESIYGTTAGVLPKLAWGRTTTRPLADGNTRIYFHVFDWPEDGRLMVPGMKNKPLHGAVLVAPHESTPVAGLEANENGVVIRLTGDAPDPICTVIELDVEGEPRVEAVRIGQQVDGSLLLRAEEADIHGSAKLENRHGRANIGYWTDENTYISFAARIHQPGKFKVQMTYALAPEAGVTQYNLLFDGKYEMAGSTRFGNIKAIAGQIAPTKGWGDFKTIELLPVTVKMAGDLDIRVKTFKKSGQGLMNLAELRLIPTE